MESIDNPPYLQNGVFVTSIGLQFCPTKQKKRYQNTTMFKRYSLHTLLINISIFAQANEWRYISPRILAGPMACQLACCDLVNNFNLKK